MFLRLLYESFRRQKRRKLLAGVAIMLGVGVATAMIAVATDIGDKISRELRTYGANLIVTPQEDTLDVEIGGVNLKPPSDGAYLNEADLPKIKGMFWRNNIVGFAPMLPAGITLGGAKNVTLLGTYFARHVVFGTQDFVTGVRTTHPWWKVQGAWPEDNSEDVLLGDHLAAQLNRTAGQEIEIGGRPHRIAGILSTGGPEDNQIVAPLCAGAGDPRQAGRGAAHLRQRGDQTRRRLRPPRSQKHVARDVRPLVLLALRAVDRIPVAGGHPALPRRADSPGGAE